MKKKIIILLILFFISILIIIIYETSYFCNKKNDEELVSIKDEKFTNFEFEEVATADLLYTKERSQIAGWDNHLISEDDIEKDDKINIIIEYSNGIVIHDDPAITISVKNYITKITIEKKDSYFQAQNNIKYDLIVIPTKVNIAGKKFDNFSLKDVSTGRKFYDEVYEQIGSWANPAITGPYVENDVLSLRGVLINTYDNKEIEKDDTELTAGGYKAIIDVYGTNKYYEKYKGEYNLNVVDESKLVDISQKIFENPALQDVTKANLLYTEVRTQIGSWVEPTVTADDIKNDIKISIIIKYSDNIIDDDNCVNIYSNIYKIYIRINYLDMYFKNQIETEYSINIQNRIIKTNISDKKFDDVSGNDITTGELLHKEVRTQMAGWAKPKANYNDILIDTNIKIMILNSDNGLVFNDDNIINTGNYKVKITVNDADIYFQSQFANWYSINIINGLGLVDISAKEFTDQNIASPYTGDLAYNEIRTEMSNWTEPVITADDIKNNTKITIIIMNSYNNGVIGDNNVEDVKVGLHNVKITIDSDDIYFQTQNETIYSVNFVHDTK